MSMKLLEQVLLYVLFVLQWKYVVSTPDVTITSSKLEILPSTARIIPGHYVVMFESTVLDMDTFIVAATTQPSLVSMIIQYVYNHTLPTSLSSPLMSPIKPTRGIAVSNVSDVGLQWLLDSEMITSITPDYMFDLDNIQMLPESWGLDRLDDPDLPMDGKYHHESHGGAGVDVYILDTGLYREHTDFSTITDVADGRHQQRTIKCGYDAFRSENNLKDFLAGSEESMKDGCIDTHGHGTHVTGIVGGLHHGVAKHSNLISVKVYDTDSGGRLSTVVAGLDYVLGQKLIDPERPVIINFSLSGPRCHLVNDVVSRLVNDANIVIIVSAGNDAASSCNKSPASAEVSVITVSATNSTDSMPSYANYGSCTNILAPGHAIVSSWIRDPHDAVRLSGTSLATPHVTGVAALYLQRHPDWTPQDVWTAIESQASRDLVSNVPSGTPNLLLNTGDLPFSYSD